MSRNDMMDKLLDEVIKEAAIQASEEMGARYAAEYDDGEDVEFSEEYKAKKAKLLNQYNKELFRKKLLRNSKRIAIIIIGFLIVSGITIFSVEAFRVRFLNMIIDTKQTHSKINFTENGDVLKEGDITLDYIPENFKFEKSNSNEDMVFLRFSDNNNFFSIMITEYDPEFEWDNGFNTEDIQHNQIEIKGNLGAYVSRDNLNTLTWHDSNYVYTLSGNIEKNEVIKIAENVKK